MWHWKVNHCLLPLRGVHGLWNTAVILLFWIFLQLLNLCCVGMEVMLERYVVWCFVKLIHYHLGVSDHCKNIIYSMEYSTVNLKIFFLWQYEQYTWFISLYDLILNFSANSWLDRCKWCVNFITRPRKEPKEEGRGTSVGITLGGASYGCQMLWSLGFTFWSSCRRIEITLSWSLWTSFPETVIY